MESNNLDLHPKSGARAMVLGIARISTEHQDERSLDDQEALYRGYLDKHLGVPYELHMIAGQGSGECLDRQEYLVAWEKVESGIYDLVIAEDLGRIARRVHAVQFVELCEDHATRVIALNDQIDTAKDNWHLMAGFASLRHELYNADTAKRIRRSLRNRFNNGGVIQFILFGYIKPADAETDADLKKDAAAAPVYDAIFTKLENGATFSEVADWLNAEGVKPGPFARSDRWDGRMLARVVFNPVLKGLRVRNNRMTKRVNSTGRRKSIKAPASERQERHCPHLAFIDPDRYDRVIALLLRRNAQFKRAARTGVDVRANVPRKRTSWPGQHATCGVCGRLEYWGGHGQAEHMMCAGARDYKCWNAVSFNGVQAADRMGRMVLAVIETLPGFDVDFVARVEAAVTAAQSGRQETEKRLAREAEELRAGIERLLDAFVRTGHSDAVAARLQELEGRRKEVEAERTLNRTRKPDVPDLPSMDQFKEMARAAVAPLAADDPEFGRVMRQIVPCIAVFPFKAIDSTRVVARAFVTIDLGGLLEPSAAKAAGGHLRRTFWVDLFDAPQRVEYRERVVALRQEGHTERQIGTLLKLKQTTVQRAMALHRMMISRGYTTDPYALIKAPLADDKKTSRHLHMRYRFEPLPGFPAWPGEQGD